MYTVSSLEIKLEALSLLSYTAVLILLCESIEEVIYYDLVCKTENRNRNQKPHAPSMDVTT